MTDTQENNVSDVQQIAALPPLHGKPLDWLVARNISKATADMYLVKNGVGSGREEETLLFTFWDCSGKTLLYGKNRNLDWEETGKPKEIPLTKGQGCFFGLQHCREDAKEIIITEGEMDALALVEAGIRDKGYDVISVPAGCHTLSFIKENDIEFLKKYDNIIVFGDKENDNSITLVDYFADKVGANKIKSIKIQDYAGEKDANDILINQGKEYLVNAVENAEYYIKKSIVQPMDIADFDNTNRTLFMTGYQQTDIMLAGIETSNLILLTADAGTGKSTMASMLVLKARTAGVKSFVYSGEMSESEVLDIMIRQAAGKNYITSVTNPKTKLSEYSVMNRERVAIKKWLHDYVFFYQNDDTTDEKDYVANCVIMTAEMQIKYNGVKFIVIDNLMTLLDLYADVELYAAQSKLIRRLNQMAKHYDVAVLLLTHPRKSNGNAHLTMDDISGTSVIKNKADIILSYERHRPSEKDKDNQNTPSGYLRVLKNRKRGIRTPYNELGEALYYGIASKRIMGFQDYMDAISNKEYRYGWTISITNDEKKGK